jgi:hypothetical protein
MSSYQNIISSDNILIFPGKKKESNFININKITSVDSNGILIAKSSILL